MGRGTGAGGMEERSANQAANPKKGDLSYCKNWRGIMLLNVASNVFSRVILERIKTALDEKLREEQAGFRAESELYGPDSDTKNHSGTEYRVACSSPCTRSS